MLRKDEQQALLALARRAICHAVAGAPEAAPPTVSADSELFAPRGAFVSLHRGGGLRGCIGYVESSLPLWRVVAENAVNAATGDPRFPPVSAQEIGELDIEISVLTPARPIEGPAQIEIGRDGLIVERGAQRGLLLPQVATEWGFGPEEFLDAVCQKAGLPKGSWHEAGTRILAFSAQVFAGR